MKITAITSIQLLPVTCSVGSPVLGFAVMLYVCIELQ